MSDEHADLAVTVLLTLLYCLRRVTSFYGKDRRLGHEIMRDGPQLVAASSDEDRSVQVRSIQTGWVITEASVMMMRKTSSNVGSCCPIDLQIIIIDIIVVLVAAAFTIMIMTTTVQPNPAITFNKAWPAIMLPKSYLEWHFTSLAYDRRIRFLNFILLEIFDATGPLLFGILELQ